MKAFEDHLGVALIQPVSSRYEYSEVVVCMHTATRVEPRILRPLQYRRDIAGDFFMQKISALCVQKNKEENHANYIKRRLCKGVCRKQKRI